MIDLQNLLLVTLLLCVTGAWWHTYQIKQRALLAVRQRCLTLDLQLLDQSVALRRMQLCRNARGSLQLNRHYDFEFSSTGDERYRGTVIMEGGSVGKLDLQAHRIPGT